MPRVVPFPVLRLLRNPLCRGLLSLSALAALPACTSPDTTRAAPAAPASPAPAATTEAPAAIVGTLQRDALAAGHAIFTLRCAVCHGEDGRKGLNGAHDLTKSNLTATGRIYLVTNGLGNMPAFKPQLSESEIEQVVAYSLTLK